MGERKRYREVSRELRIVARELRRANTEAEAVLWEAIRSRQLHGLKFRRQHAVGRFVLDFLCAEHHLVIELDGGVHDDADQAARDAARTAELEAQGYRILRFRNEEVLNALPEVLGAIHSATRETVPPLPLAGEGARG